MDINYEIERFLRETHMPATKFGRLSVRDPRLVHDMRRGREFGPSMQRRVRSFIERQRSADAHG